MTQFLFYVMILIWAAGSLAFVLMLYPDLWTRVYPVVMGWLGPGVTKWIDDQLFGKRVAAPDVTKLLGSGERGLVVPGEQPGEHALAVPTIRIVRCGRNGTRAPEYSFILGGGFLENMIAWRTTGIEGRYGSGKTLLSVVLAKYLYERGYVRGVFSNFPIKSWYIPYVPSCINTCIILDEGAAFADARDSAKMWKGYGKYIRKMGSYLLSPSVYAVDRRMRPVACERNVDIFMLGWWVYTWHDPRNWKGSFILQGYESVFDAYDHTFIPADDGGILETLEWEAKQLAGSMRQLIVPGYQRQVFSPYANPLGLGPGDGRQ